MNEKQLFALNPGDPVQTPNGVRRFESFYLDHFNNVFLVKALDENGVGETFTHRQLKKAA
jgi:hypothetical protein